MKKFMILLNLSFFLSLYGTSQNQSVSNCDNTALGFNYIVDSSNHSNIHFAVVADSLILDQLWSVYKVSSTSDWASVNIHKINPSYEFLDSGYYKVCIQSLFRNHCKKDFCDYITITSPPASSNSCNLQLYPNPATTLINTPVVLNESTIIHAGLYNSLNVLIMNKDQEGIVGTNMITFNIVQLEAGNYYLKLAYGNTHCSRSFVKE